MSKRGNENFIPIAGYQMRPKESCQLMQFCLALHQVYDHNFNLIHWQYTKLNVFRTENIKSEHLVTLLW